MSCGFARWSRSQANDIWTCPTSAPCVSVPLYLTTRWHDYTMTALVPLNHHFICLSACILTIPALPSVSKIKNKKSSTHNCHGHCQTLCLLYNFCRTMPSLKKKKGSGSGTTSTGFKHQIYPEMPLTVALLPLL